MARLKEQFPGSVLPRGLYFFGEDVGQVWQWFREGYKFVEAAGGAVTDGQGRLLAIHRWGRWDLPKGKVEPGEALQAAAVREVSEECGLQRLELIGPLCETWHTYVRHGKEHLKCTHWFRMAGDASEPLKGQAEEGIDAVRWMDAGGMAELRAGTYPSLQSVITAWEAASPGRA